MYLGIENKAKSKNKVTKEIANAKKTFVLIFYCLKLKELD